MRQFSQHGLRLGGRGGICTGELSFVSSIGKEAGHLEGLSAPAHYPPLTHFPGIPSKQ